MTDMAGLDEIIHQSTRLRIMAALHVMEKDEWIEFMQLKALVGASDGNLGAHLETLSKANYIESSKQIVGKKPLTRIRPTPAGRAAYHGHVAALRTLLDI